MSRDNTPVNYSSNNSSIEEHDLLDLDTMSAVTPDGDEATTSDSESSNLNTSNTNNNNDVVDHGDINGGIHLGLPHCRLYARYFGGDVHIQSMPGHGTSVYINLNHLGFFHEEEG